MNADMNADMNAHRTRLLKDGALVDELEYPVKLEIYTKCPFKWILWDAETGQWYRGTACTEIGKQWQKIS